MGKGKGAEASSEGQAKNSFSPTLRGILGFRDFNTFFLAIIISYP